MLWFVILNLQRYVSASVSCIGENGHPVDWFIVYKLPRMKHSTNPYLGNGVGYIYMDSSSYQFKMPSKSINSKNSTVGYTLQQIYISHQRSGDVAFLMYNDEDPSGKEPPSKAHSKGVLGLDTMSGFWLIHSVPKFPPFAKDGYSYPETAQRYGQSFLCVTFKMLTFNDIGLQLLYNGRYLCMISEIIAGNQFLQIFVHQRKRQYPIEAHLKSFRWQNLKVGPTSADTPQKMSMNVRP